MKALALALTLAIASSCGHFQPKPALDCALVHFEDALPQILQDLDNWAALDADAIRFGKDVFVCALSNIQAKRGASSVASDRAEAIDFYRRTRGI